MSNRPSALITGSSRGLGRALASQFSANGYDIILHGRDLVRLAETAEAIRTIGGNYTQVIGDIREGTTIEELTRVGQDRDVSVLVNNAGIYGSKLPLGEVGSQEIRDLVQINLVAPILLTQGLFPTIVKNSGAVININSITGYQAQVLRTVYSAAKWGLRGFSDSLKLEAQKQGVHVFNVFTSRIKTQPQFTYGMEPDYVAQKIYLHLKARQKEDLLLDERPVEHRQ